MDYAETLNNHVRFVLRDYLKEVENSCFCWMGTGCCQHYSSNPKCMSDEGVVALRVMIITLLRNHINISKFKKNRFSSPEIIETIHDFITYICETEHEVDNILRYVDDDCASFQSYAILYPNLKDICDQIKIAGDKRISSYAQFPTSIHSDELDTYYSNLF